MTIRLAAAALLATLAIGAPSTFARDAVTTDAITTVGFRGDDPGFRLPMKRHADGLAAGPAYERSFESSAKGGNAEQPNKLVPNYGMTSGGPSY